MQHHSTLVLREHRDLEQEVDHRSQPRSPDSRLAPSEPRTGRVPASTYRLQITEDFDLFEATSHVPYLHDLGVDWVYLSPLLAAESGSTHGYDVVAFDHVDDSRGGAEGLAALSEEARRLGLGVLVDIVPNHIGVATPAQNAWWWDVPAPGPRVGARRRLRHRLGARQRPPPGPGARRRRPAVG